MNHYSVLAEWSTGRGRRTLAACAGIALGCLVLASSSAAKTPPNPEFEPFAQCPVAVKHLQDCLVAQTTSGEFVLGSKTVPITSTITLQGGVIEGNPVLVPAANGETLSKTPLTIPGGLTGLGLELGETTEVKATSELAGPVEVFAQNLEINATVVRLPLKVRLENQLLGESCYVGSDASPILLNLTAGTTKPPPPNQPISGNPGTAGVNASKNIITIKGTSLVDNAFSAPGAEGCGGLLSPVIDEVVDLQSGLPAAAGTNTAILKGSLKETTPKEVKKSKVIPRG